ncbi:MAG: ATP-dependent RecD-like DNA helicase, partial [Candidatus Aminicenantes bacterium]|nr:ATP-dependent RecD-like DNA helicase [Candidatus Aminicenantes bacterium]
MDHLSGTVESIVFYNPDNGYTVCRFLTENGELLTIVGNFPPISPGESMKIKGKWELNPKFGRQLHVENYIPVLPTSIIGIEKFLSSGMIKGIGPVLAKRIIRKFGEETMDILSRSPEKMRQVEGVGSAKLKEIKSSWNEHKDIRDLIIFLQEHNISTNLATKIYKFYGDRSYHVLNTNPYQACHDIWGIGFKTADQIALKLGMSPTSPERIRAYILYLLEKDNEQGHVFSFQNELEKICQKDLEIQEDEVKAALKVLTNKHLIRTEEVGSDTAVYLPFFYEAQKEVAASVTSLSKFPVESPKFDINKAIAKVEGECGVCFSNAQKLAIKAAFYRKILVITGGPGTGKTTIIRAVKDIFEKQGKEILLSAPTGRAAKRLSEATNKEAKTIHRTLEYNPKTGTFRKGKENPLRGEALIVDEFSMVDLPLMFNLLKAVPPWMRLIIVGDKDQLPSVGPGNLLEDIIESGVVEVIRLDQIFRQEKDSLIIVNAHRVNRGESLKFPVKGDKDSDFYFIPSEDEQKVFSTIINLCSRNIPQKFGMPPLSPEIQVISPMYRGMVGVDNLNRELQAKLNPGRDGLKLGNREIRVNDKVMQIRNNYNKEIFNGDIGIVKDINKQSYRIVVDFDGKDVLIEREEINEIALAYAISVHKSQGNEYKAVVIPLLTQHFIMLQRNLFYTALTRAKRLTCVIG